MKFRFVDRITSWEPEKHIAGSKTVSFEEYSLRERLGTPPALPETLVLESFFQLSNWLIVLSSGFRQMGLIVRFENVTFDSQVLPGERLDMRAEVVSYRPDGVLFRGEGRVGERLVTTGAGCLAAPVPLSDYVDPQYMKDLFEEIQKPVRS